MPVRIPKTVNGAILMRARAKEMEDEAKGMKIQANDVLLPWMASHEIKDLAVEGVGKVIHKAQTRSRLDKGKLTEELLKRGVDASIIYAAIGDATIESRSEYVEFRRANGGGQ